MVHNDGRGLSQSETRSQSESAASALSFLKRLLHLSAPSNMPAKNRTQRSRPAPPHKPAVTAPAPQQPASRATRPVKRRGRAQAGSSDDEITREALSDASDGGPSDSDSDSDHPAIQAPPTPVSPHRPPKQAAAATMSTSWADDPVQIDTAKVASTAAGPLTKPFVSDRTAEDDSKLPVVDFEDFNAGRTAPLSPPSNATTPPHDDLPKDSGHRTLRQAYMDRLNSGMSVITSGYNTIAPPHTRQDPSFVPFVGSFYGHDDRFMDLPFRKMNRWAQRGANFRGRGGFRGGFAAAHNVPAAVPDDAELPPTERSTWKHDGYEELSRFEDRRQAARGRGAFRGGRGRGAFRGGFVQQSAPAPAPAAEHPTREPESAPAAAQPKPAPAPEPKTVAAPSYKSERRIWFIEKPERTWTRQTDTYLFNDMQPRPPRTEVTTSPVRIKLPGTSQASIVKVPTPRRGASANTADKSTAPNALSAGHIVIKLGPAATSRASKPVVEATAPALPVPEPAPAMQLRPEVAPYEPLAHAAPFGPPPSATTAEGDWVVRPNPPHVGGHDPAVVPGPTPGPYPQQQQQFAPPMHYPQQPQPGEHPPYGMVSSGHGSPMYHSPSGYEYPLPSAYDAHGRPMYFSGPPMSGPPMPGRGHGHHPSMSMGMSMPPPPPMMYGPPPAQQMHARHESVQFVPPQPPAEFYAQQQQQQPGPPSASMQPQFAQVVDPETGRPFFKPARATVRIQIRAPGSGPVADAPAPQQALASPPAAATESRVPAQPVSGPAPPSAPVEFVPQHQHHPSMSMSAHNPYAGPQHQQHQQQQHGGAHYYYPPQMDGYAYGPGPMQQQQQQQMGYAQQQQQAAYGEYYVPQSDGTVYYH